MPTNLPDLDSYPDLTFPEAGLDLSAEFETQAPNTTPVGTNVRAYEPLSGRDRGGSRQGLSRYVSTTVAGAHLIQHLNLIVDPTPAGLPAYSVSPPPPPTSGAVDLGGGLVPDPTEGLPPPVPPAGTTTDPSTNPTDGPPRNNGNREPRDGGSGDQPNRNLPPPPPPPPPVALVQSTYQPVPGTYTPGLSDFGFTGTNATRTVTLGAHVADGNVLVAVVAAVNAEAIPGTPTVLTVRNAFGDAYTQAGAIPLYQNFGENFELSVWFRVAQSGTSEDAVKVTPNVSAGLSVCLMEFSHVLAPAAASLDAYGTHQGGPSVTPYTTGAVASLVTSALVAAFSDDSNDPATESGYAFGAGVTQVCNQYDGTDMPSLWVAYRLLAGTFTATLDAGATGGTRYNAVGASFKQA